MSNKISLALAYDEAYRAAVSIGHLQVFIADENLSEIDVGRVCHVLENLWRHFRRLDRYLDNEALRLQCRKTRTSAATLNGRTAATWIELTEVLAHNILYAVFDSEFLCENPPFTNSPRETTKVDPELLQKQWPDILNRLAERGLIDSDTLGAELQIEFLKASESADGTSPTQANLPPLTKSEKEVLLLLNRRSPALCTLDDCDLDRRTASAAIKGLIEKGYAHRPAGERGGATLTNLGKEVAESLAYQD